MECVIDSSSANGNSNDDHNNDRDNGHDDHNNDHNTNEENNEHDGNNNYYNTNDFSSSLRSSGTDHPLSDSLLHSLSDYSSLSSGLVQLVDPPTTEVYLPFYYSW